ncbi:MAG: ABC transporter substrate-binding protein [Rhodobacteraceae bacterium]|nr:ABC transporter substrate-binding protein [Paracoccaceae bacterium]
MPFNNPNRRLVLAGGAAALLPLPALALTENGASTFVQGVIDDVFGIINSSQSEARVLRRFKQVFTSYADINIIARSVLGPPYRSLSNREQRDFSNAFGHYISYKYGRQFREFQGADITITRTRDAGSKGILVSSQVRQQGQSPFQLDWQVSDRSGQVKLINLIIEGLSLLTSEREEIRGQLAARRGDVNALTAYLAAA